MNQNGQEIRQESEIKKIRFDAEADARRQKGRREAETRRHQREARSGGETCVGSVS